MIQIGCVLLLLAGLTLMCPWLKKNVPNRPMRWMLCCMGMIYCVGNLCFTLLCRTPGTQSHVELMPFRSYLRLLEVQEETAEAPAGIVTWFMKGTTPVSGIVLNVLLYYPLGYLALQIFPKLKPWQAIGIGLCCSIVTEAIQYFFQMGWCETDDVIHNMFGTALGVWVWCMQNKRSRTEG